MKRKLLRCVTALSALLLASCSSDPSLSLIPNNDAVGEEMEVTFSISAESAAAMTRADGGPGQWQTTIGKGTKIDMLIYAVYEKGKDESGQDTYTLLKQFGKGIVEYTADEAESGSTSGNKESDAMTDFRGSKAVEKKDEKAYDGQTIMYVGEALQGDGAVEITLRLMRNKEYHIAFWAQSSQTAAFDTDDLTQVKVDYEGAENNDEFRDAFCKVKSFKVVPSMSEKVVLTRPFAQINVGTTGADYKFILDNDEKYHAKFVYSEIELEGVSNTINVVTDQIGEGTDEKITFTLNRLPAFIKMEDIPTTKDGLIQSEDEEFLMVDLDYDGKVPTEGKGYKTDYPTLNEDGSPKTEVFKYLSMCYVLVPASTNASSTDDPYTSSILKSLLVTFRTSDDDIDQLADDIEESDDDTGESKDEEDESYVSTIELMNVPVHRNWRTNILCGLYQGKLDDDDPNTPNDPTSIFQPINVWVQLAPDYEGEYNGRDNGSGKWANFFGTSGN